MPGSVLEVDDHSCNVIARVSGFHDLPPVVRLVYELHRQTQCQRSQKIQRLSPLCTHEVHYSSPSLTVRCKQFTS